MFWGNIVALFAVIPILGVIAALVGGIMELIAIVNLRKQSEKYSNAFWLTIIAIILGFFTNGNDGGMWSTAINLLRGLATLGATYYICTATEDCVRYVSYEVADYCRNRPCDDTVGAIALVVVAIFQLIASIRFLIMLWKCQGVL